MSGPFWTGGASDVIGPGLLPRHPKLSYPWSYNPNIRSSGQAFPAGHAQIVDRLMTWRSSS